MTGYTSFIADGEITNGADFLKLCSRAFGIFAEYRDEPLSADIPTKIKYSDYYERKLEQEKSTLIKYLERTDSEWQKELQKEIEVWKKDYSEAKERYEKENERLARILEQIKDWNCSERYKNIKAFAIEQIKESFNDMKHLKYFQRKADEVKSMSLEEYKQNKIDSLIETVKDTEESIKAEKDRVAEAQSFLDGFLEEISEINVGKKDD